MSGDHRVPPAGPVFGPQLPPNFPGNIPGAPLNANAAQTAAKTNLVGGNVLTLAAVLCAGASFALFFSAIFVSSAFAIPYAISMVATIVFGFLGDCTKPKAVPGQPAPGNQGQPPYLPPPPPGHGAGAARGVVGWPAAPPPDPKFVVGQPVQLKNQNASCFISASFQEIMVWAEMKDALVATCKEWDASFTAFNKLISWLREHKETDKPTAEDVPLLISFLSSDFGGQWYDIIKRKVELLGAPRALQLLDEYVKGFERARFEGRDDPKISGEDVQAILPLFEYELYWSSQNVDTFIRLMQWIKQYKEWLVEPANPAPRSYSCPREDALNALLPIMCRPEYEKIFHDLFNGVSEAFLPEQTKFKLPSQLVHFQESVAAAIEQRKKEVQAEAAAPGPQPFFDFLTAVEFVMFSGDVQTTLAGVKGFLTAVEKYDDTGQKGQHRTQDNGLPRGLEALRNLLPPEIRHGQQDGAEMISRLFNLLDKRKYPDLFFPLGLEQSYAPYNPEEESDPLVAVANVQRLERHIRERQPTSPLPAGGQKKQRTELYYEIPGIVPHQPSWGQELFSGVFEFHEGMSHDTVIYLDPASGEPRLYKIAQERVYVDHLPDTFLFSLKRFISYQPGRAVKNDMPVVMPEYIKYADETFEIVGIMQHSGTIGFGHYVELSKKDGQWWFCDDLRRFVAPATPEQLKHGLTYGYQYVLKSCKVAEPVRVLQDWPPAELPVLPPPPKPKVAAPTPQPPKVEEPPAADTAGTKKEGPETDPAASGTDGQPGPKPADEPAAETTA